MADTKVVVMVLKVDLQCDRCYKKVKTVLCQFPQIRDQIYDEKQNLVIIKVVCCSPQKLRDKIFCMARGAIKSIEIKAPEVPTKIVDPPLPKNPIPPPPQKVVDPQTLKVVLPPPPVKDDPPATKKVNPPPVVVPNPPPVQPVSVNICVPVHGYPMGLCCRQCYEGEGGGPCHSGYVRPGPCCDGCASGRPVYNSYGGGRACYVAHCEYLNEENASGCSVM